jgi:sulfur carrier protein ThiS
LSAAKTRVALAWDDEIVMSGKWADHDLSRGLSVLSLRSTGLGKSRSGQGDS